MSYSLDETSLKEHELRAGFGHSTRFGNTLLERFEKVEPILDAPIRTEHAQIFPFAFHYREGEGNVVANPVLIALKRFVYPSDEHKGDTQYLLENRRPPVAWALQQRADVGFWDAVGNRPGDEVTARILYRCCTKFVLGHPYLEGPSLTSLAIEAWNSEDREAMKVLQNNSLVNLARLVGISNSERGNEAFYDDESAWPRRTFIENYTKALSRYITRIYADTHLPGEEYKHSEVLNNVLKDPKKNVDILQTIARAIDRKQAFSPTDSRGHGDYKLDHVIYPKRLSLKKIGLTSRSLSIDTERAACFPFYAYDLGGLLSSGPANIFVPERDEELVDLVARWPLLESVFRSSSPSGDELESICGSSESELRKSCEDNGLLESYVDSFFSGLANCLERGIERHASLLKRDAKERAASVEGIRGVDLHVLEVSKPNYVGKLLAIADEHKDLINYSKNHDAIRNYFRVWKRLLNELDIMQKNDFAEVVPLHQEDYSRETLTDSSEEVTLEDTGFGVQKQDKTLMIVK